MNRACFSQNENLHEQKLHTSSIRPLKNNFVQMKYSLLIFLALFLSCTKKDNSNCYVCTTTWVVTTDTQVTGYPSMTTTSVELCNITSEEISVFEETNQSSESTQVGNVLYSSSHSTKCTANQK